jgi:uncharacterized protein
LAYTVPSPGPSPESPDPADAPGDPGSPDAYGATARTVPSRHRERAAYDRELVHSILDEEYVCHLGFVRDGAPVVLPTLYARSGERLYLHGSTGSRPLLAAGREDGLPVCVTVTLLDGLVLARAAFHHSLNYRSVVVHGTARRVPEGPELTAALDSLVDAVVPGRAADSRRADARELAATAVLRLDLEEVSAKVRQGGPSDDPEDMALPHWSGVVPVARSYGEPVPAGDLAPGTPLPAYLDGR